MSDYLAQVVRQRDAAIERARKAEQLLAAAEDELQKRRGQAGGACQHQRTIDAVRRIAARIRKLDPHRHSEYLMGAKNTAAIVTRTIDRAARKAAP
jgi:hypothetical protein